MTNKRLALPGESDSTIMIGRVIIVVCMLIGWSFGACSMWQYQRAFTVEHVTAEEIADDTLTEKGWTRHNPGDLPEVVELEAIGLHVSEAWRLEE